MLQTTAGIHRRLKSKKNQLSDFYKLTILTIRSMAPFEQMTGLFAPPIKVLGIRLLQSLHESSQRRRRALNQWMDVVGHQAEGVNCVAALPALLRQSFKISK